MAGDEGFPDAPCFFEYLPTFTIHLSLNVRRYIDIPYIRRSFPGVYLWGGFVDS